MQVVSDHLLNSLYRVKIRDNSNAKSNNLHFAILRHLVWRGPMVHCAHAEYMTPQAYAHMPVSDTPSPRALNIDTGLQSERFFKYQCHSAAPCPNCSYQWLLFIIWEQCWYHTDSEDVVDVPAMVSEVSYLNTDIHTCSTLLFHPRCSRNPSSTT